MISFIKNIYNIIIKSKTNTSVDIVKTSNIKNAKSKIYSPNFLDDSYSNEYSLLRFENKGYFNFEKYFKGYYDDEDIKVKVLFPDLVKELIDVVGIKSKTKTKLYYNLDEYKLILNNDWVVKLYKLNEKKFSSMAVDSIDAVFIVGVSSDDNVKFSTNEINNCERSNSYGMNFVSETYIEFEIEQIGVTYIYEEIEKFKDIKVLK